MYSMRHPCPDPAAARRVNREAGARIANPTGSQQCSTTKHHFVLHAVIARSKQAVHAEIAQKTAELGSQTAKTASKDRP